MFWKKQPFFGTGHRKLCFPLLGNIVIELGFFFAFLLKFNFLGVRTSKSLELGRSFSDVSPWLTFYVWLFTIRPEITLFSLSLLTSQV